MLNAELLVYIRYIIYIDYSFVFSNISYENKYKIFIIFIYYFL